MTATRGGLPSSPPPRRADSPVRSPARWARCLLAPAEEKKGGKKRGSRPHVPPPSRRVERRILVDGGVGDMLAHKEEGVVVGLQFSVHRDSPNL